MPSIPRVHRRSWRELFGDGCSNVWKWWGEVSAMNSNPFLLFLSFLLFQGSQHIGGKYCTIWCSSCFILELFPRLVPTWKIAGTPSDIHAWWRRKMFCTNVLVTVELHCQNLNLRSFNFWNFLTFIWEAILSARLFPRRRIVSKQLAIGVNKVLFEANEQVACLHLHYSLKAFSAWIWFFARKFWACSLQYISYISYFPCVENIFFLACGVLFFRVVRSTELKNIQIFKVYGHPLGILWSLDCVLELLEPI